MLKSLRCSSMQYKRVIAVSGRRGDRVSGWKGKIPAGNDPISISFYLDVLDVVNTSSLNYCGIAGVW